MRWRLVGCRIGLRRLRLGLGGGLGVGVGRCGMRAGRPAGGLDLAGDVGDAEQLSQLGVVSGLLAGDGGGELAGELVAVQEHHPHQHRLQMKLSSQPRLVVASCSAAMTASRTARTKE